MTTFELCPMKNILNTFILILFCLTSFGMFGQQDLYFRNYQTEDGLSSNTVTSILQDKQGFMWFGTRNGLNRFDGNSFRIFQNDPEDKHSIGNNSITCLARAIDYKMWVGTRAGVFLYDPTSEYFEFENVLPSGLIQEMHTDRNGNVWLLADGTLYFFDHRNRKMQKLFQEGSYTRTIFLDASDTLWSAESNGDIRKFDLGGRLKSVLKALNPNGHRLDDITQIGQISTSQFLIATQHQVMLLDTSANKTRLMTAENGMSMDVNTHSIFLFTQDECWLATEKGLYILNIASGIMRLVQKEYGNPYSLTDNVVFQIYKDTEGGIWLGTFFGGVNYYSQPFNGFRKYLPRPEKNSLSGNIVHEIIKDKYGQLWIGTEDAGLNRMDPSTGKFYQYGDLLAYNNIHGLCTDDEFLWIGTYDHGIDVMDLRTKKVVRHYDAGPGADKFKSNFIVTIFKDSKGDMLIGTWDGLFRYNRKTDSFETDSFFNTQIQGILETQDGTLYAGSYVGGLSWRNPKTGKEGRIGEKTKNRDGLISKSVNSIYQDRSGNIWACTERGLTKYDPEKIIFQHYTIANGLPSNQVFKIMEDLQGNLWITTANGLACLNPKKGTFQIFHRNNGLPTEQFNYNSMFRDSDGTFYIGTVTGMVSFSPTSLKPNTFVPPVFVTGIEVNNVSQRHFETDSRNISVLYTKSIDLPYDNSNISFDVAALSYMIPEMNQYRYILNGADKTWTYLKNNRRIYYTNLPPGDYTFKVMGANNSGVWNSVGKEIEITIFPPWWLSWWAYLIYIFIIIFVGAVIFRYYHLAVSEKNKRQIETIQIKTEREIFDAKLSFFTNIAHEIRTPLTLIRLPLEKLLASKVPNDPWSSSLEMIRKNTDKLINLTNQLLDFRKMEANKLSLTFVEVRVQHLLQDVFDDFRMLAEERNLSYQLEMPRHPLYAFIDENAFTKILHNLVHNAIKYSGSEVAVKLLPFSSEDSHFYIELRNDGELIPEALREKIFEPFYRIREKDKTEGTGIGLPLSRTLAEMHNGSIKAHNVGSMNVFVLSMAIHQDSEISVSSDADDENPILAVEGNIPDPTLSLPTILVVEDNKDIRDYLTNELKSKFQVSTAANGKEALDFLSKKNVQLIISDIMMPVMDGIELCREIKNNLEYSHIPVILLTAKNSLPSKIEGLESGADAYIEKPFSMEFLQAQAESLLNNREKIREFFAHSPLTHIKSIGVSRADQIFLEQLSRVIDQRITDADLDVEQLSALMNMSRPTLYRKIKGISDLSPNELINLARLKKAAEYLAQGDYKINEVAMMVGYKSHSNFSRDFQRQFQVSPTSYINNKKG